MPRHTFSLPGLSPGAVAPDLVRVGNLFFTSGVRGVDLRTGELPDDPAEQFLNAWHNLAALVEGAGLSLDNVGLVSNFIDSQEYRPHINAGWLELFPAQSDRPARKTTSYPLPHGVGVELQAMGAVGQRRSCIEVKGLTHRDPLPNAARLGDYVFTSVIVPWDLSTSEPVVGEDAQTDQCFDNMRIVMEEAGGTIDDVVLQWVYLNDFAYQPYMVDVYLEAWPIGQYQAARKTFRYPMGGQIQIQCIGRIGGSRSNHEIPGHGHHDPIPMGARVGDVYASSGVSGVDTAGPDTLEPVEGAAGQAHHGLRNVVTLAEEGGMSAGDIGLITVLVQDHADVAVVDREWSAVFPDPNDRPARQIMQMGLQRRSRVQYHMLAALS
jgi:enamine deaminase RidA (YjgF/YER057c/UK114 family)